MNLTHCIGPVRPGLFLTVLTLLFGIFMGVSFGVNEDAFKDKIKEGIATHQTLHDSKSQNKIWRYAQRAHFHATGIGAFTLGLVLLLALTNMQFCMKRAASVLIGLGGVYPLAWYAMYQLAPSMGRHAAHESLPVVAFTYIGVGSLLLGLLLLIGHLLLGLFTAKGEESIG